MKAHLFANRHTSANRQTGASHIGTGHRHFPFLCFVFFPGHIMEEGGMVAQAAVPPHVPSHLFHHAPLPGASSAETQLEPEATRRRP